jgi:hypothetical protein
MIFQNPVSKKSFELRDLEADFFRQALEKFRSNIRWSAFENFAFNPGSPIYARRKSYGRLTKDPLYQALQDMWLQLGINQGEIQDDRRKGEKSFATRREESTSRKAGNQSYVPHSRKLEVTG